MGSGDSERDPKLDEPGWADRLVDDERLWPGQDHLVLDSDLARAVWGAVLCNYMARKDGGVRSIDQCAGKLGWFHLRLTLEECRDLFKSTADEGLIEPASELHSPASDAPEDEIYRRTAEGKKLKAPRGAGAADTVKRAPEVVAKTFKLANVTLGAAVASLVFAAARPLLVEWGVPVGGAATSQVALILGGWLLVSAFVIGAYSDERALRVCAQAWPRMKFYRPARHTHATARLRTPLPLAAWAWATIVAGLGAAEVLLSARTPPESVPQTLTTLGGSLAVLVLLPLTVLSIRSRQMRRAYREEYGQRRSPFNKHMGPVEDEGWWKKARRVFWHTVRRR